jgi:hypothetical protein
MERQNYFYRIANWKQFLQKRVSLACSYDVVFAEILTLTAAQKVGVDIWPF